MMTQVEFDYALDVLDLGHLDCLLSHGLWDLISKKHLSKSILYPKITVIWDEVLAIYFKLCYLIFGGAYEAVSD